MLNFTQPRVIAALMLSASAIAAPHAAAANYDYDYIQLHAQQSEYAFLSDFQLQGFEVRAGYSWDNLITEVRYRDLSDSHNNLKLDDDRLNLSVGWALPLWSETHVDVRLNYGDINLRGRGPDGEYKGDDQYWGVSSYLHHQLTDRVNLYAGLEVQDWKESTNQKAYHLGARYRFNQLSVGAEYTKYSDSDAISVYARYSF